MHQLLHDLAVGMLLDWAKMAQMKEDATGDMSDVLIERQIGIYEHARVTERNKLTTCLITDY